MILQCIFKKNIKFYIILNHMKKIKLSLNSNIEIIYNHVRDNVHILSFKIFSFYF